MMVKESLREKLPPSLNIKSADLRVLDPIGQGILESDALIYNVIDTCYYITPGEFGIVYKGYHTGQYTDEVVAIKTLKGRELSKLCELKDVCFGIVGFIDNEAVQELLSECIKMKNLNHQNVMTLKGVCLDGGPVPYIILPYMANGSLLSYLKKERSNLTRSTAGDVSGEEEKQSHVNMICWIVHIYMTIATIVASLRYTKLIKVDIDFIMDIGTNHQKAATRHVFASGQRNGISCQRKDGS